MIADETLAAYLDGAAEPDDARRIESSLDRDPDLRARLDALKASDRDVRAAFDGMLARPVPEHLVQLIRAAKIPTPAVDNVVAFTPRPAVATPTTSTGRTPPKWVGWAVAAQIGLIAIGAALFLPKPQPAAYHVLGSAPSAAAPNLMVMFRPETTERDMREALVRIDAQVVGGPTSTGAWLLRTPAGKRAASLELLHRRADIILAQPVDSGSAQ